MTAYMNKLEVIDDGRGNPVITDDYGKWWCHASGPKDTPFTREQINHVMLAMKAAYESGVRETKQNIRRALGVR